MGYIMDQTIRQTKTGRLVIRSAHRRRSIRAAIFSAMLHSIAATCLLAGALQLYCLSLGADDLYLGLLNFTIWGGAPFLLLGITLMRRFGKRRILVFWAGYMPAACMAFVAVLPLMGRFGWISSTWILYWLLGAALMRSVTDSIGGAGWFPMLQDNVPSRITGKFFGIFRIYWQSSVLVSLLLIAWFLGSDPAWWRFCVVFGVGEACFIAKIYYLKQLKEKPIPKPSDSAPSTWGVLKRAVADGKTRHFLGYILLYNIAAFMCLPFQIKYLKDLGYGAGFIVAATSMVSVGAIVSLRFWGKLADRFGNRSIFSISHIGLIVVLAAWVLVGNNAFSSVLVFVLYAAWSIFQSGNGIAQTRHMFHTVPEADQSNMVIINAFIFISIAMAPLISGLFLKLSADWHFDSGGLSINHYHMLFLMASALVLIPHRVCKKFQNNVETSAVEVFVVITRPLRMLFGSFVSFPTKRNGEK
jgi:MFS family permease